MSKASTEDSEFQVKWARYQQSSSGKKLLPEVVFKAIAVDTHKLITKVNEALSAPAWQPFALWVFDTLNNKATSNQDIEPFFEQLDKMSASTKLFYQSLKALKSCSYIFLNSQILSKMRDTV